MAGEANALAGAGLDFMLGQIGGASNAARLWKYQKRYWSQGPSLWSQGMKEAGLNPILMSGGGGLGQTLQAQLPAQDSGGNAMMAGVALSKAISEIQLNESIRAKNVAETRSEGQSYDFNEEMNKLKIKAQELGIEGMQDKNKTLAVERQIAEQYGLLEKGLDIKIKETSAKVAEAYGMDKASAELVMLGIANDMAKHNYEWFETYSMPDHGLPWTVGSVEFIVGVFEQLLKESGKLITAPIKKGVQNAERLIEDYKAKASKKLQELKVGAKETLEGAWEKWKAGELGKGLEIR